jgi:hypothetical protein
MKMVDLTPAPNTLHLASPAVGPWFRHDNASVTMPTLATPSADLSIPLTLDNGLEWRTPATATLSYFFTSDPRPPALQGLRQESGASAFSDNNFIVLLTLLPEVELRLWALTQPVPSPDGAALPPSNTPTRPRIRYLAMEIPAATITTVADLENIRPEDFPADLTTDEEKASYIGLSNASGLANGEHPVNELCRPNTSRAAALKNRTGSPLALQLWCFDFRGRPLDPGAVANWWAFMASTGVWDNLWAHDDAADQRTASVAAGRFAHIVSAHEGPLSADLQARLNLTGLTQITGSSQLYTVGTSPAIAFSPAPNANTDTAPIPRLAALPNGSYAAPASATPFAGWTGSGWPAAITRDFLRVGILDIEQHIVGRSRSDQAQSGSRQRISPARNTAAAPLLLSSDAVSGQLMTTLTAGANAVAMSPVMDLLWGSVTTSSFGSDPLPDTLQYTIHALAGEGTTSNGGSVADQRILVHFEAGALPANCWIRLWSHGLDTATGRRFRQDGGAGKADASGEAFVVLPIPDGAGAPADPAADPVRLSFDALVVTDTQNRYFVEEKFSRPVTIAGSRVSLPTVPGIPAGTSLWVCEQGTSMNRGSAQYESGQTILSRPDDPASGNFALVDLTTLDATDVSAATLINSAGAGDTLITTLPAFAQIPDGDLHSSNVPNSATLVHRTRNLLTNLDTMGRPVPTMERRELAALDQAGAAGVIGTTPGRASNHEAPPPQLGHAGVPASAEIHGVGLALSGPATNQLAGLMGERRAEDLIGFLASAGTPSAPAADPGGTTTWTAVLETLTHGVVGDSIIRAFLAAASFLPGQTWQNIKSQIESALGIDIDAMIDTASFNDDTLATAMDRMILKTRDGAAQFAASIQNAIGRAEDFLYIETPAIDPHAADSGSIDVISAIVNRWTDRPALSVMLCVPEKFLPLQTERLEDIRTAGVGAALKALQDANPERIVLFSPTAGSGRALHMASTTVIVDDALLLTGSTHLWRRGLTFDSSLAVGLFDENVFFGRPSAVRTARMQLMANALGLPLNLIPEDPQDCLEAIRQINRSGGLGRVKTGIYTAAPDSTNTADLSIWNPDGRPGAISDWFLFLGGLTGSASDNVNNVIR